MRAPVVLRFLFGYIWEYLNPKVSSGRSHSLADPFWSPLGELGIFDGRAPIGLAVRLSACPLVMSRLCLRSHSRLRLRQLPRLWLGPVQLTDGPAAPALRAGNRMAEARRAKS